MDDRDEVGEAETSENNKMDHQRITSAECLARVAATFTRRPEGVDPVERLRHYHVQQLALWHAQRALDDFWGSGSSRRTSVLRYIDNRVPFVGGLVAATW